MYLLVINPGGTSTKVAVYEDKKEVLKKNITHTGEDLKQFPHVFDEYEYRKNMIVDVLERRRLFFGSVRLCCWQRRPDESHSGRHLSRK